jgi:hypothetical protein
LPFFSYKPGDVNREDSYPNARQRETSNGLTLGLSQGLRRGLGSGLMMMVSGAPVVLAGGSSLPRVLALFANLCASVSVSLQRQAKVRQIESSKIRKSKGAVKSPYSLSASLSLNEETSKSASLSVSGQGGGVDALERLAAAGAAD